LRGEVEVEDVRVSLARQQLSDVGVTPTYVGAEPDGHRVPNDGRLVIHLLNAAEEPREVVVRTGYSRSGLKLADRILTVPAGGDLFAGPFDPETYNQRDDQNHLHIDYIEVEGLAVAALQMP